MRLHRVRKFSPFARTVTAGWVLLGSLLITACGSSSAKGSALTAAKIQNYKFAPAFIVIHRGDSVTWTNKDADQHSVTADPGQTIALDSSGLRTNAAFKQKFTATGVFHYHCKFHPFMTGTVTIKG